MRIALISPYSWTFPGGVTRHVDALARQFMASGHHVRVLSPVDPDDRTTRALHRRRPEAVSVPDYVIPLGRTFSLPMNGAVSTLAPMPETVVRLRNELRAGRFDVVHVHEPVAPLVGWDAACFGGAPVVGTFHAYSAKWLPNAIASAFGVRRVLNKLHARIAVSEAARWTGERYFGGRYHVMPNGVDLDLAPQAPKPPSDRLRIVFVGREEERKGLPILLSAFAGLRQHVPVSLDVIGAAPEGVEPLLAEVEGGMDHIAVHGRVSDPELWQHLHAADVLCAPSLGGESFGMVLTEAFAAGTPVVASDIAGYRQVVTHGRDGLLVPHGRPLELAEALRSLWLDRERCAAMGVAARRRAADFAWPHVAEQVDGGLPPGDRGARPGQREERAAVRVGLRPADMSPRRPARRLPSLEPAPLPGARARRARSRSPAARHSACRPCSACCWRSSRCGGWAPTTCFTTLVRSSPSWVLIALALFSTSMVLRAVSWYHIVRAALPERPVKRRTIMSGTAIGVLMSATLPARLGEPSRALVVARRLGRMRETLPVVAGTLVSQTLLNLLALLLLAVLVLGSSDVFRGHEGALVFVSLVPVLLAAAVLIVPSLMNGQPVRLAPERDRAARARGRRRDAAAAPWAGGLQAPARRAVGDVSAQLAAWGAAAARRLRAPAGAQPRQPRRHRRRRGGAVRGQRDRGAAGDPVERRCLPARGDHGADRRLRRPDGSRAGLRDHPAGASRWRRPSRSACRP